ncbi:MAG TPA: STAS domain-containing protein [Amycolatopsis sp.]|uniref:STAS domain-containing protein n=1 Tax=Amycolatopsis sp. TaxID=37632 RepID=UPI002B46087D|nr:STAS domain-containing protein [Amycolatopsis sp.]HKS49718.1 STAS domain-containing protein [Amycolatopsis sp.]
MKTATVEVRTHDDEVSIRLTGDVDLANAASVQTEINEAIGNHVNSVVLDLSEVTYLDSAGLRILFTLAGRLRTLQTTLELLVPATSPVRRILELSGLPPFARLRGI